MRKLKRLLVMLLTISLVFSSAMGVYSDNIEIPMISTDSINEADDKALPPQIEELQELSVEDIPEITISEPYYPSASENSIDVEEIKMSKEEMLNEQKKLIEQYENENPVIYVEYYDISEKHETMESLEKGFSIGEIDTVSVFDEINAEVIKADTRDNMYKLIEELKKDKNVKFVSSDYIPVDLCAINPTDDPGFANQWGLYDFEIPQGGTVAPPNLDIAAYSGWENTNGGRDVIVAVLDSGIDVAHPDLRDNIYKNSGEIAGDGIDNDGNGYVDDVNGWDFFNNDNTLFDSQEHYHGTHVAGIIGARDNTIGGIGVAPNVKILPCKIFNIDGKLSRRSAIINALNYAHEMGAKVVNCSWFVGYFSKDADNQYYDISTMLDIMTSNSDTLYVCAAGNNESEVNSLIFPAGYGDESNIITVAAIDQNGDLASFSNYGGPTSIAAPGVSIYSTLPSNRYGTASGTSMAAPFVAGIAALLYSNDLDQSGADVKSTILDYARPLESLDGLVETGGIACASAPKKPSVKFTNITTNTVTVQINVPYEKMCGNGLYVYDFTDQVWLTNTNQWNLSSGTYTISGLKPGHRYDVQLYWYTDQDTYWEKRMDRMNYCTAALTNGASILAINPTRTSTYLKVTYPPSATHRYYIVYIHEDENGNIINEYVPNSDKNGTYYVGGLIPEKFYNCFLCWDNADGELETLMIQLYLE